MCLACEMEAMWFAEAVAHAGEAAIVNANSPRGAAAPPAGLAEDTAFAGLDTTSIPEVEVKGLARTEVNSGVAEADGARFICEAMDPE
jgi:hypothetical protein